ncbi:MAG: alpha/beta hydrolase [Candidatus Stahlbacteria bacterium]|nr:MAG: alpha/beta hydrolase [Candidatus Stahlbacteria bacterium]
MKVKAIFFIGLLFLVSCIRIFSLDGFLFEPTKVDEYLRDADLEEWDARLIIPDSLIEPVVLTSMGNSIYGFFITGNPDSSVNNHVTILYCHGKDENINREWYKIEHLWEMGFNAFIFDYQGYGRSEGEPSGEALFSDGEVSLSYLQSRTDIDTMKIVFYGWSIGSFVATYLASDIHHPAALILESAPASVTALLHDSGLINLPGSYVAEADFDNEKRIADIECPLFMMHGKDDDFTVLDRHFPLIWDKAEEPKDSLLVDNATHDNIPDKLGDIYHQVIIGFINQYVLNP